MRVDKALVVLPFCGCMSRNAKGQIDKVWTPAYRKENPKNPESCFVGHAKHARVTISRPSHKKLVLSCKTYKVNSDEGEPCPALEKGYICFHCLAALMLIAEDSNVYIKFHKEPAKNCFTVNAGAEVYFTVSRKDKDYHDPEATKFDNGT